MKTTYEKSIEYAEINDDKHCNLSKNFDKFDIAQSFEAGAEFMQKQYEEKLRWIRVEDELPNLGDDIILKLREHPLKKYQVWHIADDYDIKLVPVYATHWRPIELK